MPPRILPMRRLGVNLLGREKATSVEKNKQFLAAMNNEYYKVLVAAA